MPVSFPFDGSDGLQPDPVYAQLRRDEPVSRVSLPYGGDGWLITSHEVARQMLADPRFSRAATVGRELPRLWPTVQSPSMSAMDPPDHTRLRRLLTSVFTTRRVNSMEPDIRLAVDELLDGLRPPADLVADFARPLVVRVICDMLGIPGEHHGAVRRWVEQIAGLVECVPELVRQGRKEFTELVRELIVLREREPSDDLITALIRARDDDDRLSTDEIVSLCQGLITAGPDATSTQLSCSVYALLTHPEQLAALRADPALLADAVEELLRFVPLSPAALTRVATENVQLGGVTVRAGAAILASPISANRDEAVFDSPDTLDLTRKASGHLAFGHGSHHCLGAPLARLIVRVGLDTVIRRWPDLRLAAAVQFRMGYQTYGPRSLVVHW